MKTVFTLLVAAIIVLVLVAMMVMFQVRYDQVAVVTTFDKADPQESVIAEPGLYYKAPWPIQKVTKYPIKLQLLEDRLEEIQTADGYAVIVRVYVAWRIVDPYIFYTQVENIERADELLEPLVREIRGVISQYSFEQLVNAQAEAVKLEEIEARMQAYLEQRLAAMSPGYGIEIEQVGIRRLILPEGVTESVFARMRETREALAQVAESEGLAEAATIRSEANLAREQIMTFARTRAQEIRSAGDVEAAAAYAAFRQNPEFAIFLQKVEALREILPNNTTFILDARDLNLLDLLGGAIETAPQAAPAATTPAGP